MPTRREPATPAQPRKKRPPATTPEAQERRMINKAMDLAERQLETGEASAQVITHYLKLGSSREKLEQDRLQMEIELGHVKRQTLESVARAEELMEAALEAFTSYRPTRMPEIGEGRDR